MTGCAAVCLKPTECVCESEDRLESQGEMKIAKWLQALEEGLYVNQPTRALRDEHYYPVLQKRKRKEAQKLEATCLARQWQSWDLNQPAGSPDPGHSDVFLLQVT